jgi:CRP/FNR family cyclic AMP-dependent transcriptional regulator
MMRKNPVTPEFLGDSLLQEIARQGGLHHFPANAVLINEGDDADSLFILLSGRVKVYSTNADGKEVVITTHGAGEYLGELALDGGFRSASVMTLEPTSCSIVTGANLRQFMQAHPDFAQHLIRKLIGRVRQATESVKSLALQDVYGRVTRLFDEVSVEVGSERVIEERLTHQDIAERVGSSREMVSRIFRDLIAGGYISTAAGRITILRKPPAAW